MPTEYGSERGRPSGFLTLFVCDIVGFGRRNDRDRVQGHLRERLYAALRKGFDESGVPFDECYREDRGDGVIIVLPHGADDALLVHPLVDRLRGELRRGNELASDIATIRLRVALHRGRVESDANGLVGTSVNHVCRLLDAPAFKEEMEASAAYLGVLASQEFYQAVIQDGPGAIDPSDYHPVEVSLKETTASAWVRLLGAGAPGGVARRASGAVREAPAPGPGRRDEDSRRLRLFDIVDLLLEIPVVASAEGRDQIVSSLRTEIAVRIPRRAPAHLDTHSIVLTCLEFPHGLEEFLSAVRRFAGDTTQMRALEETIARLGRRD
jgi:effector-associated domain 2 (EAD2)-containing protein